MELRGPPDTRRRDKNTALPELVAGSDLAACRLLERVIDDLVFYHCIYPFFGLSWPQLAHQHHQLLSLFVAVDCVSRHEVDPADSECIV